MIQPDEIRRKAENLYPMFLRAWLEGDEFFPRMIPCRKQPVDDIATAGAAIRRLRDESKEMQGFGYSIEWIERNSRTHGRNRFPHRIVFESRKDFLRYIGKQQEFAAFSQAVERIRSRYPELDSWVRSNRAILIECALDVEGLLEVVEYLRLHPRPGIFARELPVPVDTKFIERNRRILAVWLDRVLPPQAIRADEDHFDRRYGLRYAEPHLHVRFLDADLQRFAGVPWPECSIPLHTLATMVVPAARIMIVENKVNLLTLPPMKETLALGGRGYGIMDLRCLPWLSDRPIWYWGDLDPDGLTILSRLRALFPQVRSLLMDGETLSAWRDRLASSGTGRSIAIPANLSETEQAAFRQCIEENLRIEQERFPHVVVLATLTAMLERPNLGPC